MSDTQEPKQLDKATEDWMTKKWRPAMGWTYMITCMADFVIFPILWSVLQALHGGQVTSQWNPITLQGAGLFHLAMGAVLGVAAWSRGQEKIAGANMSTSMGAGGMGMGMGSGGYGGMSNMSSSSYSASTTTQTPIMPSSQSSYQFDDAGDAPTSAAPKKIIKKL